MISNVIFIIILSLFSFNAFAEEEEVIEFPQEELATETVLPLFDETQVVKERAVTTAKRFEIGAGGGLNLTEALYNNTHIGFTGSYHFNEIHAFNVNVFMLLDGLSNEGEALRKGEGLNGDFFDPSLAPHPELMYFGNYQFTAYYGKISITKKSVMNLSLYALGGLGMVSFGDVSNFAADVGIGQKLYFNKNWGFRLDLRLIMYNGPAPTSKELNPNVTTGKLSSSEFTETTFFDTYMTAGLIFLL